MDLKDATLMILAEFACYPEVARLAQSAYDALADGDEMPHWTLGDMLGEASAKGVLRVLHRKYSATAYEAPLMPICREIDRQRPVPPRPRPDLHQRHLPPLTSRQTQPRLCDHGIAGAMAPAIP